MTSDVLSNPTVIAAAIAAVSALAGGLFANRVKKSLAREDLVAASLVSQVTGWDKYTTHLMARIGNLEKEMSEREKEYDRRLENIEEEMRRRESECKNRIEQLEKRLRDTERYTYPEK